MANHEDSRKSIAVSRLKSKLLNTRESLSDQFEFKMFVIINFKNETKKNAVFVVERVFPVMTNDYEQKIMEGVKQSAYSEQSTFDLISQDVVQLHARKWQNKRRDVIGGSENIDFMIWPRNDILSIQYRLFSRWKHEQNSPFKHLNADFTLHHQDINAQIQHYRASPRQNVYALTNPEETAFLFLSRHDLDSSRGQSMIFRINSVCVYLPQHNLMNWTLNTLARNMQPLLDNI